MEKQELKKMYDTFCKKVCENLGLELCQYDGKNYETSMLSSLTPNYKPKFKVDFTDLSGTGRYALFLANIVTLPSREYVSDIGMEVDTLTGEVSYENYENSVFPYGELWQYYEGNSLKRACNSVLKGNSTSGRKPIKKW